jgi:hypothetical protein
MCAARTRSLACPADCPIARPLATFMLSSSVNKSKTIFFQEKTTKNEIPKIDTFYNIQDVKVANNLEAGHSDLKAIS